MIRPTRHSAAGSIPDVVVVGTPYLPRPVLLYSGG